MLYFIIIIGLVSGQISFNAQCTCSQLQSQQDCTNLGCTWSGSACSSTRCSSFKSEVICILAMSRCTWSTSTMQCISNDCTTLKTKLVETCSYYGCGQLAIANSDSSYSCTNSVFCSSINQQLTCQTYPYCGWQNNSCYDYTCTQQSFTAGCPPVRSGVSNSRQSVLCFGSNFKCRNTTQADIDGLYSFNCNSMTGYSFTWSTALNKCVPCSSTIINSTPSGSNSSQSTSGNNSSTTVNNTNSTNSTNGSTTNSTSTQPSTSNSTQQTPTNSTTNTTNTTVDSNNQNCSNCNNTYNNITQINNYAYIMAIIEIVLILL